MPAVSTAGALPRGSAPGCDEFPTTIADLAAPPCAARHDVDSRARDGHARARPQAVLRGVRVRDRDAAARAFRRARGRPARGATRRDRGPAGGVSPRHGHRARADRRRRSAAGAALDRQVKTMYGQALVLSNRTTEALELADRMQAAGAGGNDPAWRPARSSSAANTSRGPATPRRRTSSRHTPANRRAVAGRVRAFRHRVRRRRHRPHDGACRGVAREPRGGPRAGGARAESLPAGLGLLPAFRARHDVAAGRSRVRQRPLRLSPRRRRRAARSAWCARMAESAALEALNRPRQELAALQEALAIARGAGSRVAEALAVVNLADVYLRRKDYREAHELATEALDSAQPRRHRRRCRSPSSTWASRCSGWVASRRAGAGRRGGRRVRAHRRDRRDRRRCASTATTSSRRATSRSALALFHRQRS